MTELEFQNIIDDLNSENHTRIIHSKELTSNVIFANIWKEKPHENSEYNSDNFFSSFYLIKTSNGEFIGLVYLMKDNLHWYLNKESRGKGRMLYYLKEIIIPNLLIYRPRIKITIDFENNDFAEKSKNLALKCGFRKHKDGYYYFSKRFANAIVKYYPPKELLSCERWDELIKETTALINRFKFMKSEVEMKKDGSTLTKKLDKAINSIVEFRSFL